MHTCEEDEVHIVAENELEEAASVHDNQWWNQDQI